MVLIPSVCAYLQVWTRLLRPEVLHCVGLLRRQDGPRSGFAAVKRPLRLLVDDVDDKAPADIAYTFSGYAPLSIRLMEVAHSQCLQNVTRTRCDRNLSSKAVPGSSVFDYALQSCRCSFSLHQGMLDTYSAGGAAARPRMGRIR